MGLFSTKKKIYVASTCYNLAGDELERVFYLKSLVLRNVLSGTKDTMGDTLINGYLHGPGIKMRTFFRWADGFNDGDPGNYALIGMPSGFMNKNASVPASAVLPYVPLGSADSVRVQYVEAGVADFGVWAEQWILAHEPARIEEDWTADIDATGTSITITRADSSTVTIPATGFDKTKNYIYIYYNEIFGETSASIITGTPDVLGTSLFAGTGSWTLVSTVSTPTLSSPSLLPYNLVVNQYEKTTYVGAHPTISGAFYSLKEYRTDVWDQVEIAGPALEDYRVTQTDTQEIIHSTIGGLKVMIYEINSGIAGLDDLFENTTDYGKFFPPIPVRIDNQFLSETYYPDEYALAKRAYKKATDNKFDDLVAKLADNPDLGDIDYVYVVFGVSINVLENACKHYIWDFFHYMRSIQSGGPSAYNGFTSNYDAYAAAYAVWQTWKAAQAPFSTNPLHGTPEPDLPDRDMISVNELVINNVGVGTSALNYDVRISWTYVGAQVSHTGLGKVGAKKGEYWLTYVGTDTFLQNVAEKTNDPLDANQVDTIRIWYQNEDNQYQTMDVVGLIHRNYIYGGKYVETTAKEGLEATEESGFIFPLHNGTYRGLPLVVSTQMATACTFLVMNSYKVVKVRWYQRGIFKILFIIILVVASVVLTGGSTAGLIFPAMSVATAGYAAVIYASIANALAALVLVTIIEKGATAVFGEELGALIGAIAGVVVGMSLTNFTTNGSFTLQWADFMKADNLLKLTDAFGRGYIGYVNAKIGNMNEELQTITADSEKQQRELLVKQYEEFGASGQLINPMMLIDLPDVVSGQVTSKPEVIRPVDDFISQTLLLGTDIVETSKNLLYDFADLSLRLPKVDEVK